MFTRWKMLGLSLLVVGGVAGVAAAQNLKGSQGPRRQQMMKKFDANNDGTLDDAERAAMHDAMAARRFEKLDANHDGSLSLEEFKAGHKFGHGMHGHKRKQP